MREAARACSHACAPPLASANAAAAVAVRAAAASQVFVDDPGQPLLSDEDVHHLGRVLRLRDGEEVIAADGRGRWARTLWRGTQTLQPVTNGSGLGGDGTVLSEAPAEPALTVAFAPVKGERPEWVVQKLTELGIDRIVPLRSERSVVRWTGAAGRRASRSCAGWRAKPPPSAGASGCPRSPTRWRSPTSRVWVDPARSSWRS